MAQADAALRPVCRRVRVALRQILQQAQSLPMGLFRLRVAAGIAEPIGPLDVSPAEVPLILGPPGELGSQPAQDLQAGSVGLFRTGLVPQPGVDLSEAAV